MSASPAISGAILTGGRGLRMGAADKGLLPFLGRPLIGHVIERLRPQVESIVISANRHRDRYVQLGFPVVADRERDFSGPLAGIARVLEEVTTPYVLVAPCDTPFLPTHLAASLAAGLAAHGGEAAVARGGGRVQPLCILLRRGVDRDLLRYRASGGSKVRDWVLGLRHCVVDFPERSDAFCNINTPDELHAAAFYMSGMFSMAAGSQRS
jgi:molybdopterin-guanine dinucleotide biosynthesis protein A